MIKSSDISTSLYMQRHSYNYIPLVRANFHCKLKLAKQDLETGESS